MSYFDYRWAMAQIGGWRNDEHDEAIKRQTKGDPPFYGVVMLAMQRADTNNLAKLQEAWPHVWKELRVRYNAPYGLLDDDPAPLRRRVMSQ